MRYYVPENPINITGIALGVLGVIAVGVVTAAVIWEIKHKEK